MAKHEGDFEGEELRLDKKGQEKADRFGSKPREDLLIRFLSGEDIDEEMDGAFASLARLSRERKR